MRLHNKYPSIYNYILFGSYTYIYTYVLESFLHQEQN